MGELRKSSRSLSHLLMSSCLLVCDSKLSKSRAVSLSFIAELLVILDCCTYTCKALLAEMCRIGDFKGVGHFEAKF